MEFSWKETKKREVKAEHNVEFDKIKDVFDDPFAVEYIDEIHSTEEEIRFIIIGLTVEYGSIFLVFTEPSKPNYISLRRERRKIGW